MPKQKVNVGCVFPPFHHPPVTKATAPRKVVDKCVGLDSAGCKRKDPPCDWVVDPKGDQPSYCRCRPELPDKECKTADE